MKHRASETDEMPLSIEHRKAILNEEAIRSATPYAREAEILDVECQGLRATATAMREYMATVNSDEIISAVWNDRIHRLEAQAAVAGLLLTDAAGKANAIFARRDEMLADMELEASITTSRTANGNIVH